MLHVHVLHVTCHTSYTHVCHICIFVYVVYTYMYAYHHICKYIAWLSNIDHHMFAGHQMAEPPLFPLALAVCGQARCSRWGSTGWWTSRGPTTCCARWTCRSSTRRRPPWRPAPCRPAPWWAWWLLTPPSPPRCPGGDGRPPPKIYPADVQQKYQRSQNPQIINNPQIIRHGQGFSLTDPRKKTLENDPGVS